MEFNEIWTVYLSRARALLKKKATQKDNCCHDNIGIFNICYNTMVISYLQRKVAEIENML